MSTNAFGPSLIKTGVTASTDGPKAAHVPTTDVAADAEGYYSPHTGYITVAGKKVMGLACNRGFFYPDSLGEEAMKVMEDLTKRGYAYASVISS